MTTHKRNRAHDACGDNTEAFVLPRVLRRPVRLFSRLMSGDVSLPKRLELTVFGSVLGAALIYGLSAGGQLPVVVEKATVATGLGVKEINIEGHQHSRPENVFAALGLDRQRSLFSIDPDKARESLAQLPWVQSGEIQKTYPGTLTISLIEREPFAIWQAGESLSVVERDGSIIGGYSGASLRHLPLLVGKGAAEAADEFIGVVAQYPTVHAQVHAYVRVGQRRWDLRLDNGMTLRLPELDVERALSQAVELQDNHGVFDRDIASVDLRFEDRIIFALTDNAVTARNAMLEAQDIENSREGGSI